MGTVGDSITGPKARVKIFLQMISSVENFFALVHVCVNKDNPLGQQ